MGGNRPPALRREIEAVVTAEWPATCVIFSGRRQPNGYGRVSIDGHYQRAHVFACLLAHGPSPTPGMDVAHSCGERMCINPRHLRWATRAENEQDKVEHGQSNRGDQRSGSARLTAEAVRAIRQRYHQGHITQQQLANEHGVHLMTINSIIKKHTWKHVA